MAPILRLLGRFELAVGSGDGVSIPGARAQLVVARLALADGERLDRSTLSTMLWGERADAQARASLRQMIWSLRQALKPFPDALVTEGDLVSLDPASIGTDVIQFEHLAHSPNLGDLEMALALYRGDLLDGIDLISLVPDGYFLHERNRLRDMALRVTGTLVEGYASLKQWENLIRTSRRGLIIDPFDEGLQTWLVSALQNMGRHREARDQDQVFRNRLKVELGIDAASQVPRSSRKGTEAKTIPTTPPSSLTPPRNMDALLHSAASPRLGGIVIVAAVMAVIGFGIWRQTPVLSAVPSPSGAPIVAAAQQVPMRNLAAYDQYIRAEAGRLAATEVDQLRDVLSTFRAAITLDPDFAAAHAGFSLVAVELWQRSLDDPFPSLSARSEAYEAAGRALQIDPGNARALIVLSRIQAQDGATEVALTSARRAVAAEPANAEARANLALLLIYSGQTTEARTELKTLQRLDPVSRPERMLIYGQAAFADGRYDAAIADFVSVWPDLPHNAVLLEHLAAALALQGRFRQAGDFKDRLLAVMPRANLHLAAQRYATLREPRQNERLLAGLRRAGLADWPYGFRGIEDQRVTGSDLAAIAGDARWSGHLGNGSLFTLHSTAEGGFTYSGDAGVVSGQQVLRDGLLCQTLTDHPAGEVCGPIYRHTSDQHPESVFAFVSAEDIRYFSLLD